MFVVFFVVVCFVIFFNRTSSIILPAYTSTLFIYVLFSPLSVPTMILCTKLKSNHFCFFNKKLCTVNFKQTSR